MKSINITITLFLVWLLVALGIDRFVLGEYCPACTNALALELKLKLPAAELSYPPVSLLVLVLFPMIALGFYLIPWRELQTASAWREGIARWCQPWFWLVVAIVLAIVGESLFIATREYLPSVITELAEKFSVTGTLSVAVKGFKETTPLTLTASLAGCIGLLLGAYLFLKKGVNEIFRWQA
jgi:hypothetical protein